MKGAHQMNRKQKQRAEAFARAHAFAVANPATGKPGFESATAAMDDAMKGLNVNARAELVGRDLSRAELRRRDQLVERLRDRHMRRIVAIAQAQIEPQSDVRLPAALRMPPGNLSVSRLLHAADAMIEAARAFEAVFVSKGLPADFLAQFRQTRDELEQSANTRAQFVGSHIGARKGLEVQFRRAQRAMVRLDAEVREAYEGNEVVLAAWRGVKRLQRRPGVRELEQPVATDPVAPSPTPAAADRAAVVEMAVAA
jgi:hypothetical protein